MKGKKMKRLMMFLLVSSCFIVSFTACSKEEDHSLRTNLAEETLSLSQGKKAKTAHFRITQGSGSYEVTSVPADVVEVKLKNDGEVEATALKVGDAEIRISDKSWRTALIIKVTVAPIVKFELGTDKVELDFGKEQRVLIVSGNGNYELVVGEEAKEGLTVALSEDKKAILLKAADKKLKTTLKVKDVETEETKTLSVAVYPPLVPHTELLKEFVADQKMKEHTPKEVYGWVVQAKKEAEQMLKKVNTLQPLPKGMYSYDGQTRAWENGRLADLYLKDFEKVSEKSDLERLWNLYQDLYTYGVGYSKIEWMARTAEEYRKKYHDREKRFEEIIKTTFDGLYTSQEGNMFIVGTNRDIISNFNKIVDIFNEWERK